MAGKDRKLLKLSASRRRWLESQVASGRFRTVEQALDFCVRQTSELDREKARIDALLREAVDSPVQRADERWWSDLRREALRRVSRRGRKSA